MIGRPVATVLVIAKAPVPGLAKTRLTPPYSAHQAAALAAAALLDTIDAAIVAQCRLGGGRPVVALTGDLDRAAAAPAIRAALARTTVIGQRGKGLAERLAAAHADCSAVRPGPTVQIGMDTPQVDPAELVRAAGRLDDHDAVLGPATDGGWWLLALGRPDDAERLVGVPMSRPDTGRRTVDALRAGGRRVDAVARLTDVDEAAAADAVAHDCPGSRFAILWATLRGNGVAA